MKPYLIYFLYVISHKWWVFLAGLQLRVPIWQLIWHDWTKFFPDEFVPYADFFYNPKKINDETLDSFGLFGVAELAPYGYFVKDRFNVAWLLHQRRNKHHWQFWYLIQDNDPSFPLPIPENHLREMVADWAGAGRAITGKWGVTGWYEKNKEKMYLRPETRERVEEILFDLAMKGW